MKEKANKKCKVLIRTVKIFSYARYSARCLARTPAVDMDLKVEALLKMQVQLKLCMNLEVPVEVMVEPDLGMVLLLKTDMRLKSIMFKEGS